MRIKEKFREFIFGKSIPIDFEFEHFTDLMGLGLDVTIAMITGGVILGIIPGIGAYFITRKMVVVVRSRSEKSVQSKDLTDS